MKISQHRAVEWAPNKLGAFVGSGFAAGEVALAFELLNRRYEKKSTIVNTNKPFDLSGLFDVPSATDPNSLPKHPW